MTEFDLASEKFLIDKIKKKYPSHGILSEESGHIIKAANFWLIDPLDGTRAFSRGIAQFCVSIAFASHNTIMQAAIYDPIGDELYFARRGRGSYLNSKKIAVSEAQDLSHTMAACHIGDIRFEERKRIYKKIIGWRIFPLNFGSVALSATNVACGRIESIITGGLFPWDYAAAGLILKEAGAKVTDFKGRPYRWDSKEVLSANPKLHSQILKLIG